MVEFVDCSTVKLVQVCASDEMAIMAARTSTDLDDKVLAEGDYKLINALIRDRHTVPFEHGIFTFLIETPLFTHAQIVKHRTTSISTLSGRYSVMPDRVYISSSERPIRQVGKRMAYTFEEDVELSYWVAEEDKNVTTMLFDSYAKKLERGVAKEVARRTLPLSTMTRMYLSLDPLNLMKFLGLRTQDEAAKVVSHPQYEVEEVARKMEAIFAEHVPVTYAAWVKNGRII